MFRNYNFWLFALLFISTDTAFIQYLTSIDGVSVECFGLEQHGFTLRNNLPEGTFSKVSTSSSGKFPTCSLQFQSYRHIHEGVGEISKSVIQNSVVLLKHKFSFPTHDHLESEEYLFVVYGTLHLAENVVKSIVNTCSALRSNHPRYKCVFIDVVKNPSVLINNSNPIPWIEIKQEISNSPIIYTHPFPNYWHLINTIKMESPVIKRDIDRGTYWPMCNMDTSLQSVITDYLFCTNDYWLKEYQPFVPRRINYLADTAIPEASPQLLTYLLHKDPQSMKELVRLFNL